jgi:hypothetical protein
VLCDCTETLIMRWPHCLWPPPPPNNFWIPTPIIMKIGMAPQPISTEYFINPSHQSMCLCFPLSLLGNGSVNMFPRQRIHVTIEELFDASFSIRPVSHQKSRRIPNFSICMPNRWSDGFQSRQRVKYGHEPRESRNQESLCWRGPAAIYWTGLCIPLKLLGNDSVNTLPLQWRTVGGIVFYAVRVL